MFITICVVLLCYFAYFLLMNDYIVRRHTICRSKEECGNFISNLWVIRYTNYVSSFPGRQYYWWACQNLLVQALTVSIVLVSCLVLMLLHFVQFKLLRYPVNQGIKYVALINGWEGFLNEVLPIKR